MELPEQNGADVSEEKASQRTAIQKLLISFTAEDYLVHIFQQVNPPGQAVLVPDVGWTGAEIAADSPSIELMMLISRLRWLTM